MSATACYEIVHFSFHPAVPATTQVDYLRSMSAWVREQPGFLSRRSYKDEQRGCWTDVVAWDSHEAAVKAAEKSMSDPSLAPIMSSIEQSGMSFGHYTEVIATFR